MSVPHIRARSSKNAVTPEDGRRNDRPKRRAVNMQEIGVNRPRNPTPDLNTSPPHSGFRKKNRHFRTADFISNCLKDKSN